MPLQANIHAASRGIVLCGLAYCICSVGLKPHALDINQVSCARGFKNPPYASYIAWKYISRYKF